MSFSSYILLLSCFIFSLTDSCSGKKKKYKIAVGRAGYAYDFKIKITTPEIDKVSEFEKSLIAAGLVNVKELDSTIVVDLRYSTTNNFMGVDVYGDWDDAFLQPDVAEKLVLAQHLLKSKFFNYNLIIFDAARPLSVQKTMWDTLKLPVQEKVKYLSNPRNGSLHNYGAAVDLSIVDEAGNELDMGTPYDFFGELAYPRKEQQMLKEGKLTEEQVNNRKLLREIMVTAGFDPLTTEWWHFNSCTRNEAARKYELIE